jgi:hypothetical protein
MRADGGANLQFFNFNHLLLLLGFGFFLLQFVFVFAEVQNFAHGRAGAGGNFHQVIAGFVCFADGGFAVYDAKIFAVIADEANRAGLNLMIDARAVIFGRRGSFLVGASYVAVSCCGSYKPKAWVSSHPIQAGKNMKEIRA